jgi:hypothetical protein
MKALPSPAPASEPEPSVQTFGMPGPAETDETGDSSESYYDTNY